MNAEDLNYLAELELRLRETNRIGGVNAPHLERLVAMLRVEAAEVKRLQQEKQKWHDACRDEEKRAEAAEATAAELQRLFDLQQTRMAKATALWREATGKHDVLPDLGDLLDWLMATAVRERARIEALESCLRRRPVGSRTPWEIEVLALLLAPAPASGERGGPEAGVKA